MASLRPDVTACVDNSHESTSTRFRGSSEEYGPKTVQDELRDIIPKAIEEDVIHRAQLASFARQTPVNTSATLADRKSVV